MAVEVFPKRKVTRPHTEISVDTSGIGGASADSDKVLMLIGSAKGGAPNTVYKIRNYQEAKRTFRSGELLDAIELAWNPGDLGGAGDILAMRVEDAEQGKLEKEALTFESKIYGNDANDIQIALEDNDLTHTKRLTIAFSKDNYRQVFDNLGKIFSIQYIGEKAQASFTLTKNENTNKTESLVLKNGDSADKLDPVMEFRSGRAHV